MGVTPDLIMSDGRRILSSEWSKKKSGEIDITSDMWWFAFTQGYAPPTPASWTTVSTASTNTE